MIAHFRRYFQLYIVLVIWTVLGSYSELTLYGILPLTLYLMHQKGMNVEIILSFFYILFISDSLDERLYFAKGIKNIYPVLLALFMIREVSSFQPINRLYKIYLPFFLFALFCTAFSETFLVSIQKTISYLLMILLIPNYVEKIYRDEGKDALKAIIYMGVMMLLVGFGLKFTDNPIVYEADRYRGFIGNPNGLGIYCTLFLILFYLLNDYFPNLFSRLERIFIYGVIVLSIYYSGSRNAILALVIFFLFQYVFTYSLALGFILFIALSVAMEIINNNLVLILTSLGLDSYFRVNTLQEGSGRYLAWTFAWTHIQENFFIGKGFAYNEYYMRKHYGMLAKMGHQGGIHNSFLTFWMDQGLVGLIIYLRSFLLVFIKASHKTRLAYPIMFSVIFTAFFESWLVGSLSIFAFLLLVIFTVATSETIVEETEVDETEVSVQPAV